MSAHAGRRGRNESNIKLMLPKSGAMIGHRHCRRLRRRPFAPSLLSFPPRVKTSVESPLRAALIGQEKQMSRWCLKPRLGGKRTAQGSPPSGLYCECHSSYTDDPILRGPRQCAIEYWQCDGLRGRAVPASSQILPEGFSSWRTSSEDSAFRGMPQRLHARIAAPRIDDASLPKVLKLAKKSGEVAARRMGFEPHPAGRNPGLPFPSAPVFFPHRIAMPAAERLVDVLTSTTKSPILDDPVLKEPVETVLVEDVDSENCPDGGLRAWLVVLGVRSGNIDHQSVLPV